MRRFNYKKAPPRGERRLKKEIERELAKAKSAVKDLEQELKGHDYCACGKMPLFMGCCAETYEDGWRHGPKKCTPPPKGSRRCFCSYAIIRAGEKTWSCASWSSTDDPRTGRIHTHDLCYTSCL
jgi:hypothetical protein